MQINTSKIYFNSYMVRLKVELQESKQSPYKHFNSYMVRLKVESQSAKADQLLFQFLYGTIKSKLSLDELNRVWKFQFLYGTI